MIRQVIPVNGNAILVPRLQQDGVIVGYLWGGSRERASLNRENA